MHRRTFVIASILLPLAGGPALADAKFEAFIQTLWPLANLTFIDW